MGFHIHGRMRHGEVRKCLVQPTNNMEIRENARNGCNSTHKKSPNLTTISIYKNMLSVWSLFVLTQKGGINFSPKPRAIIQETVRAIMAAKALNKIIGQPTTESMNIMTEHMANMVTGIKTTTWGEKHGSWNSSLARMTTEPSQETQEATIKQLTNTALVDK